jgi:hypothetical protein
MHIFVPYLKVLQKKEKSKEENEIKYEGGKKNHSQLNMNWHFTRDEREKRQTAIFFLENITGVTTE